MSMRIDEATAAMSVSHPNISMLRMCLPPQESSRSLARRLSAHHLLQARKFQRGPLAELR